MPTKTKAESDNTWALIAHLSGFAGFVIPFGNILAPLLIWLLKKQESAFVEKEAKEALNFQISVSIYTVIAAILVIVLLGFILVPVLLLFDVIVMVLAAISVASGTPYRYPLTIRFIK